MSAPTRDSSSPAVTLRDMSLDDLPALFEQQRDPEAMRMAAFMPPDACDWEAYRAKWTRLLGVPSVITKTIVADGVVAGSIASWVQDGEREITYGVARDLWGRGIATNALAQFLGIVTERPLHARAAKDNAASLAVLRKCGFVVTGEDRGFAHARGAEIEELVLRLD